MNNSRNIEYVKAGKQHIPQLIQARIDFFIEHSGPKQEDKIAELKTHLEAYLSIAIEQEDYIGWLAMADGEIAGAGGIVIRQRPGSFINPTGREAYVMSMYTAPAHRRKGIAATILNNLVAVAKEMGVKLVELHATPDGEPVYVKNGFKLHPEPTYRMHL